MGLLSRKAKKGFTRWGLSKAKQPYFWHREYGAIINQIIINMKKETFRTEIKKLLANAYQRMVKHVDSFCDTDYEGFDSYKEDVSQMDFVNALLSLEARNHSPIGCSEGVKRKSKKRVEDYKTSIIYNR